MARMLLLLGLLCISCDDDPAFCVKEGATLGREVKYANGGCMIHCPEPVGWISWYMWESRGGCGSCR